MADEFTKAALYGIKTFNKKVKEKIGMQKLIELLYEFYGSPEGHHIEHNEQWESYYYVSDIGNTIIEHIPPVLLVSKKFGFIKWLVENDKIDRDKFEVEYADKQTLKDVYIAGAKQDELLIMLLSISDTPIEDLISYLK